MSLFCHVKKQLKGKKQYDLLLLRWILFCFRIDILSFYRPEIFSRDPQDHSSDKFDLGDKN